MTGGDKSGLVEQILEVGTAEARSRPGNLFKVYLIRKLFVFGMNLQNFLSMLLCRKVYGYLPVKTSRAQQRFIQDVRTVRCGHNHHSFIGLKSIQFGQQLVQGLFTLIMATAKSGPSFAADGVNLINEDDTGLFVFGLFKHIADALGANPDKQDRKSAVEGETVDVS